MALLNGALDPGLASIRFRNREGYVHMQHLPVYSCFTALALDLCKTRRTHIYHTSPSHTPQAARTQLRDTLPPRSFSSRPYPLPAVGHGGDHLPLLIPAGDVLLTAGEGDVDAVGCPLVEQAGLSGAGAHVHLLDAAVYGTYKEESGLPGRLRLLLQSSRCPAGRSHSPQSTKRRGSARAVAAAPSARSRASGDGTMAAAAAGTAAAPAAPRCHMRAAAPPAGQPGRAPPAGPGRSHPALPGVAGGGTAAHGEAATGKGVVGAAL